MKRFVLITVITTSVFANALLANASSPKSAKPENNTDASFTPGNPGDREGHDMTEVVPEELIPEAPILNVSQALSSFHVHPDFIVETIASEPLVFDPVVATYDAKGRLWVAEMTTYMSDILATGEMQPASSIAMLEDTNNDGAMDKRHLIIDKILLPRALAFVDKGILWADHETLYFSELDEKDGKITVVSTEVVDSTYAKGGNIEHKPNSLSLHLDNWYYSAKSDKRYRPYPLKATLPPRSEEIYRNKHWKMARASTEFRGQWGITHDDFGRHYFNDNWTGLHSTSFLPNVAGRNPAHKLPVELSHHKVGTSDVYPVRVTPGINRGYQKDAYNEGYRLKQHTSACAPLIYRGNQFPDDYYGIGLAAEPAGNLIKGTRISEVNGIVSGENLFGDSHILASTDERFRPVNLINSPDGTITLVDFYHGIVQHRTYLTTYLAKQIKQRDLETHRNIGRLYRLRHKQNPVNNETDLSDKSTEELVALLAHDNGWHRDKAQYLLVNSKDNSAVPLLTKMATDTPDAKVQIKALWTLEGLGYLSAEVIKQSVLNNSSNDINKVKRSAYRLSELLSTVDELTQWLINEVENVTEESSPALMLALGTHQLWQPLATLIKRFGLNDFALASLSGYSDTFLQAQKQRLSGESIQTIENLIAQAKDNDKMADLRPEILASMQRGEELYSGKFGCFGCHGSDGEGSELVPPLNKSEWVTGSKQRLAAILLHGLAGEIVVRGKTYNGVMPGLGANKTVSDQALADVATYIRRAWANDASHLSASDIAEMRANTEARKSPYNNDEIKSID